MAVTLENRLHQMQVFNLVHDAYCRGRVCACSKVTVVVTDENPRTGERALRRVPKKVPGALTLLAREVRSGLPASVLAVPDVRAAIVRGALKVVAQKAEPLPAPVSTPALPPSSAVAPARPRTSRARKEN